MGWSLTIGRIAGTSIRLHFTFLLFLAWIGISDYLARGPAAAASSLAFIVLVFVCVCAHEFGHILMGRHFGIRTPEVILSPIGGIANMERLPDVPSQELLVSIAGPLVNVVIAAVLIAAGGLSLGGLLNITFEQASLLERLALVNASLVVFNLIPAFPMDGGRVLQALLAMGLGQARATQIAARIGQIFAFVFVLAGLFFNPMLMLIGGFIYLAATAEEQTASFRSFAEGLDVSAAVERAAVVLPQTAPLSDAVEALLSTPQRLFPVADDQGRPAGLLDRDTLLAALKQQNDTSAIATVMRPCAVVRDGDPLIGAVNNMRAAGAKAEIVVDQEGRIAGLLTIENIAEMLMVHGVDPAFDFRRRPRR